MMTGEMSCHAAHNGPFDAPFSIRSACGREKRNCRQRACKGLVHRFLLPLISCGFQTRQTIKSSNGPFSQPSIRSPSFGGDERFTAPGNRGLLASRSVRDLKSFGYRKPNATTLVVVAVDKMDPRDRSAA
jgi:hypothetical protein